MESVTVSRIQILERLSDVAMHMAECCSNNCEDADELDSLLFFLGYRKDE